MALPAFASRMVCWYERKRLLMTAWSCGPRYPLLRLLDLTGLCEYIRLCE